MDYFVLKITMKLQIPIEFTILKWDKKLVNWTTVHFEQFIADDRFSFVCFHNILHHNLNQAVDKIEDRQKSLIQTLKNC